jgi:hypothetical protein
MKLYLYTRCLNRPFDDPSQVRVLLTTDDGFLKAASRFEAGLPVANPVVWLMEIMR